MHLSFAKIAFAALAAALGSACLVAPAVAQSQPPRPRAATPASRTAIRAHIVSVDGPFHITVRDERGVLLGVALHQGTIINPRGARLAAGMSITLAGYTAGAQFLAYEIDAPYASTVERVPESYTSTYDSWDCSTGYNVSAFCLGTAVVDTVVTPPATPAPTPYPTPPTHRRGIEPIPGRPDRRPLEDPSPSSPPSQAPASVTTERTIPIWRSVAPAGPAPRVVAPPPEQQQSAPRPQQQAPPPPQQHAPPPPPQQQAPPPPQQQAPPPPPQQQAPPPPQQQAPPPPAAPAPPAPPPPPPAAPPPPPVAPPPPPPPAAPPPRPEKEPTRPH